MISAELCKIVNDFQDWLDSKFSDEELMDTCTPYVVLSVTKYTTEISVEDDGIYWSEFADEELTLDLLKKSFIELSKEKCESYSRFLDEEEWIEWNGTGFTVDGDVVWLLTDETKDKLYCLLADVTISSDEKLKIRVGSIIYGSTCGLKKVVAV
jgi:hypothetical protein